MFTMRASVAQPPDVVAKFVRASIAGWRGYLGDPAAAHAVIAKPKPALNPNWMDFTWHGLRDGHFVAGPSVPRKAHPNGEGALAPMFDSKQGARWTC